MDYYFDIRVKPDAEMRKNVILNKVYTKFHKALSELNSNNIGVSFPEYNIMLGCVLRIHGTETNLQKIQSSQWLGGLIGYCQISTIQIVPEQVKYRTVSRIQSTMSPSKLKRLIKRGSINDAEVSQYKAKMFQKGLDNPYLELESATNSHLHRRYLSFGGLRNSPTEGLFDHFGLSKIATIPWF